MGTSSPIEWQNELNHLEAIWDILQINKKEILNIIPMKSGMTNYSYCVYLKNQKYMIRVPGEGTSKLLNRHQETSVYNILKGYNISDEIYYINPETGYKVTRFFEDARTCDINNWVDVQNCMNILRTFHSKEFIVEHSFDLFERIDYYESLRNGLESVYEDYFDIKQNVLNLKDYIEKYTDKWVLSHIDSISDNFLIYLNDGKEEIRMIDWEYAAMHDPHIDIAMFAIYAGYNKSQIDQLIDCYFQEQCPKTYRIKIYAYISACGLLWSNWCEYKRTLGIEFGKYAIDQYQYAKEYSEIVKKELSTVYE